MEPLNVDDVQSRRGLRRAETLPVRFAGLSQREVVVQERTDPNHRRRELRGDALRRESTLREENLPKPGHLRRQGSSFREPIRPTPVPHRNPRLERRSNRGIPPESQRRAQPTRNRSRSESTSDNEWGQREDLREEPDEEDESESEDSSYEERDYKHIRGSVHYRHHHSRKGYESSEESEDESDVNRDAYAFSLPRHSRSSLSQDNTLTESESYLGSEASSGSQAAVGGSDLGTTHHVYRSQYTGEGSIRGLHSAKLTVIHDPKKGRPPLFRWIHFEDPAMHFEQFQHRVAHISRLTDIERTGLVKLLGRAKKTYYKPLQTSNGTDVRSMEPGFLQETLSPGDRPKEKSSRARTVTWLCLPYFCLPGCSAVLSTSKPDSHPMQTLLQAQHSLGQTVSKVPSTPTGSCLHIAQIWCLILDDSLLVTCTRIPMPDLQGDWIDIPDPIPEQLKSPNLLVSYGGSLLWSFQADDCQTWFAFISNFWEFWPRKFRIVYHGMVLTADHWPKILNIAKHTSHSIRLTLQIGSAHKAPIRGILNIENRFPVPENTAPADIGPFPSDQGGKTRGSPLDPAGDKLGNAQASTSIRDDAAKDASHPHADADSKQGQGTAKGQDTPKSSATQPTTLASEGFHIFTWLNAGKTNQGAKSLNVDEEQLKEDLENMDHFLRNKTSLGERIAYKDCPQISRLVVYSLLEQEWKTMAGSAAKDERKRIIYECRVDIVNAAESIFQFFLPSLFEGPTVLKYWGAIHRLLVASSPDKPRDQPKHSGRRGKKDFHPTGRDLWEVIGWLEVIVRRTQPFKDLLSQAQTADPSKIKIPDELLIAWLHLIMSLINMSRGSSLWDDQINICSSLMNEGMKKVVQDLNQKSLLEKSVFMPFEVASLVNFRLLKDATPDISMTYFARLKQLEAKIDASPLDRAQQGSITLLKQEVLMIIETLAKQSEVFASILTSNQSQSSRDRKEGLVRSSGVANEDRKRSYAERDYYSSRVEPDQYASRQDANYYYTSAPAKEENIFIVNPAQTQSQLSPTDPGGYRDLLAQDCFDHIEKKILDFNWINRKVTELEKLNIEKIGFNKDRQESAIYAFTIVTIVFLPLSTVAGILGMNTNDVRNMNINQWVFWAVALPLTFIIITLCLLWSGELEYFWRGFANLWRRGSDRGRGEYMSIRDGYSRVVIRDREQDDYYYRPRERERRDLYGNRSYSYV